MSRHPHPTSPDSLPPRVLTERLCSQSTLSKVDMFGTKTTVRFRAASAFWSIDRQTDRQHIEHAAWYPNPSGFPACLGMAWAWLPVNRKVDRPKMLFDVSQLTKPCSYVNNAISYQYGFELHRRPGYSVKDVIWRFRFDVALLAKSGRRTGCDPVSVVLRSLARSHELWMLAVWIHATDIPVIWLRSVWSVISLRKHQWVRFLKARLGQSRITEILYLDFWSSTNMSKTRTVCQGVLLEKPSHIQKQTEPTFRD